MSEHSSSAFESIVEHIEQDYPFFVQTSSLTANYEQGTYLLIGKPAFQLGVGREHVLMRVDRLGEKTSHVIGEIGRSRFDRFLEYEAGWDGIDAKKLSLASVAMLEVFVANYDEFRVEPSLFLTRKGNLKLAWEDSSEMAIEVEFAPTLFKYYVERNDEEGKIKLADVQKLVNKIRSL